MNDPILCDHGQPLAQDPCNGCTRAQNLAHVADPVQITPPGSRRPRTRCRRCAQPRAYRIHIEVYP